MKCFLKISEEHRNDIFKKLYVLNTKDEQDIYLQGLIEQRDVNRRSKQKNHQDTFRKNYSFFHFVIFNGKRTKVCLNAFLSLHGVSNKRIKRIKNLLVDNLTPKDKRGYNPKTHAISEEHNIKIREHIESFPKKETHYSGKMFEYLDARLNFKIMYKLFKTKHPNSSIRYSYYVKYFHEHYDFKFGRPQIDTCCKCEELDVKIKSSSLGEAAKKAATAELLVHKRRAKTFYSSLRKSEEECKNRDDLVALSFDYMQNVHLPEIPVQDLFYLTQLTVNVFGIHNLKTGEAYYYVYHEGIGGKGPNEVCSFVLNYIENYVPPSTQELRLYSDNCPGQNKNHTMVRMCMALVETKRFKKVEQFFPIRGHSFLPCDRDFGLIKKRVKKHDRIFSVHQYTEIIVQASARNRFTVNEIKAKSILEFKNWWPKFYKKSCFSLESDKKGTPRNRKQLFTISQFHHFIHETHKPGYVTASEFINSFMKHTFPLGMPRNKERVPLEMPKTKAYPENKLPIIETKIEHLKQMLPYVENDFIDFYRNIIEEWPTKPSRKKKN